MTHICVTRPQWVNYDININSLWSTSDRTWSHSALQSRNYGKTEPSASRWLSRSVQNGTGRLGSDLSLLVVAEWSAGHEWELIQRLWPEPAWVQNLTSSKRLPGCYVTTTPQLWTGRIDTLMSRQNGCYFADDIHSNAFSEMIIFVIWLKFHGDLFQRGQLTWLSIGSDNGLVPNRWQAIILTKDGIVPWCIYASLMILHIVWQCQIQWKSG